MWSAFHSKSVKLADSNGNEVALDAAKGTGVVEVSPARQHRLP